MRIRWVSDALRQLDGVHAYYAQIDQRLAARMFRSIEQAVEQLKRFPTSGRKGYVAGTLELTVPHRPYLIVYRVTADEIQILRVFHTAMDWRHAQACATNKETEKP